MSSKIDRKGATQSAFGKCANCAGGAAGGFVLSHITCFALLGLATTGAVSAATISSPVVMAASAAVGLGGSLAFWARRRWPLASAFEKAATPVSMIAGWSLALLLMGGNHNHHTHPQPSPDNPPAHQLHNHKH